MHTQACGHGPLISIQAYYTGGMDTHDEIRRPCTGLRLQRSHALQLDQVIQSAAYAMIQHNANSAGTMADDQLHLPVAQGGLGVPNIAAQVPQSVVASWAKSWPHVRNTYQKMTTNAVPKHHELVVLEPAIQSLLLLNDEHGIQLSTTGHVVHHTDKSPRMDIACLPHTGIRHIQSNVNQALALK